MSLSNHSFRRRIVGIGLALGLGFTVSGCFTPLYMSDSDNNVADSLRKIAIVPMPDRLGHYIGTELIFLLNGSGETIAPKYRLSITTTETNPALVIDSLTGRADSASIFVTAEFKLISINGYF